MGKNKVLFNVRKCNSENRDFRKKPIIVFYFFLDYFHEMLCFLSCCEDFLGNYFSTICIFGLVRPGS